MTPRHRRAGGFPVLPRHGRGQRIGLLGGSFNPAHEGHRLISLIALRRLRLDSVWWIVTPGNPLKSTGGLPPLGARLAAARALSGHPRIAVTGFEAALNTRYSVDTVRYLQRRCPGARFVWIMGSDLMAQLPRWRQWRAFLQAVPLVVVDRPGSTLAGARGPAAALLGRRRLPEHDAAALPGTAPPAYVFLHGPRSALSSTRLRGDGGGR